MALSWKMNQSGCFRFFFFIDCEPWSRWLHNDDSHFNPLSSSSWCSTMSNSSSLHFTTTRVIGLWASCVTGSILLSVTSKKPFILICLFVYFTVAQLLAHVNGNLNPGTLLPVSWRELMHRHTLQGVACISCADRRRPDWSASSPFDDVMWKVPAQ